MKKQTGHYEALDGLRGIAALGVFCYHMLQAIHGPAGTPLEHAACVVDFFFCLSGYVIAHAYDDRLSADAPRQMRFGGFALRRIIRLHPMVVVGLLFGFTMHQLDPFAAARAYPPSGHLAIASNVALGLLLLPAPPLMWGMMFSLNPPSWSLAMEYISNVLYGLFGGRTGKWTLAVIWSASAIWLFWICFKLDSLELGAQYGNWWVGLARLGTSFTMGMLLCRLEVRWRIRHTFPVASLALLVTMLYPAVKGWNGVSEWLVVVVIYPCIVMVGAGVTRVEGRWGPLCRLSGRLSYPLYMMHAALVAWFGGWVTLYRPEPRVMWLIFGSTMVAGVAIAWVALRLVDEPVRAWLTRTIRREV